MSYFVSKLGGEKNMPLFQLSTLLGTQALAGKCKSSKNTFLCNLGSEKLIIHDSLTKNSCMWTEKLFSRAQTPITAA